VSRTAAELSGWLAAARYKFPLKRVYFLMAAVNLQHPGSGERERRVLFLKSLSLSLARPPFPSPVFSLRQKKVGGVLPCLSWSAFTCGQPAWKVSENILKEVKNNSLYFADAGE